MFDRPWFDDTPKAKIVTSWEEHRVTGKHVMVAVLLVAALSLGCGLQNSGGAGSEEAASSPTSAPQLSKSETAAAAKSAVMDLSTFHAETRKPTKENTTAEKLATLCHDVPSDSRQLASHLRVWDGETLWIRNNVIGYKNVTGAEAVAEVRREHQQCKTRESDGEQVTILPPVKMAPPEGIAEVFVYCERYEADEDYSCNAFLPHGNFVSEINAEGETQAEAAKLLEKLVPIGGKSLLTATA